MPVRLLVLILGLILLISGLGVAAVQIVLLERGELEHVSAWYTLEALAIGRARQASARV